MLSLGSALALAGVSAWLITRAWQMPPVLDLSVAVVAVRTFAISRGVLHYCERLATHDTALRAAGTARAQIYHRLGSGPPAATVRLHSGELVARVGADVDELADVLVVPWYRSASRRILGLAAVAVIACISPAAAVVLAICLVVAGVVAPWLAGRAAAAQEAIARQHHSERDTAAMIALEHAPETSGRRRAARCHRGSPTPATCLGHRPGRRGTDRPLSPRQCPRWRSAPACWALWWPGSGWRPAVRHHTGRPDVVAAVRIRGDDSTAGRRGPVDTVTACGPSAA